MSLENAGPTLHQMLWGLMDEATAKVLEGDDSDKAKGEAIGISKALALFTNPYNPKPKAIRKEAKSRWAERQKEEQ